MVSSGYILDMRGGIRSKKIALKVVSLPKLAVFFQKPGKQCSGFFVVDPKMCVHIPGSVLWSRQA